MNRCPGPSGTPAFSRRAFLSRAGSGFALVALNSILQKEGLLASTGSPYAARPPHFRPKAERVIFLFMSGGPSHVDLYDPKPELINCVSGLTMMFWDPREII